MEWVLTPTIKRGEYGSLCNMQKVQLAKIIRGEIPYSEVGSFITNTLSIGYGRPSKRTYENKGYEPKAGNMYDSYRIRYILACRGSISM